MMYLTYGKIVNFKYSKILSLVVVYIMRCSLLIRKTTQEDLAVLDQLFDTCRAYMKAQGNPTQWDENYPTAKVVAQDVLSGHGYVCVDKQNQVLASFALCNYEAEYDRLQNGKWNSDEPYIVIHRMGALPEKGAGNFIFKELTSKYPYIRIDTHEDNKTMLHLLEKFGFKFCGIVHYPGYGDRVAYDYVRPN